MLLFFLGVLFSVAAISGVWAFWQLQQASEDRLEFAQQLAQQSHRSQALESALTHAQQQLREERAQRLHQQQALKEQLRYQQQALAALTQQLREPAHELMSQWRMETARILLSGVAAQLYPGYNVDAARRLLDNALELLAPLLGTQLVVARRAIKADLAALETASLPDLPRYRYQLNKYMAIIETLSLRRDHSPVAATPPPPPVAADSVGDDAPQPQSWSTRLGLRVGSVGDWWHRAGSRLGAWLAPLVEVRRVERPEVAPHVMSPAVIQHRREQLRLRLEQMHLALPQHDAQTVREAAGHAIDWLARHFDPESQPVGKLRDLLEELVQLQLELPLFWEPPSLHTMDALLGKTSLEPLDTVAQGEPIP